MKKLFIMVLFLVSCGIVPEEERYTTNESIRSDRDNSSAVSSQTTREILVFFRK